MRDRRTWIRSLGALAVATVAVGCSASWVSLRTDQLPGAGDTVADGVVVLTASVGFPTLSAALWGEVAVQYADGVTVVVAEQTDEIEGQTVVFGPTRLRVQPTAPGFLLETGGLEVAVPLETVAASLPIKTWNDENQAQVCTATVTLSLVAHRFRVTEFVDPATGTAHVEQTQPGRITALGRDVTAVACPFELTAELKAGATDVIQTAVEARMEDERSVRLGPAAVELFSPRLGFEGAIATAEGPADGEAAFLALRSLPTRLLVPQGDPPTEAWGAASFYDVGIRAEGGACAGASYSVPTEPLPRVRVPAETPAGESFAVAVAVHGSVLDLALARLRASGLLERLRPVAKESLGSLPAALWPTDTPLGLRALAGNDYAVRLGFGSEGRAPTVLWQTPEDATQAGIVRVAGNLLRLELYGAVAGVQARLATFTATDFELDLQPQAFDGRHVKFRPSRFSAASLTASPGLLSPGEATASRTLRLLEAYLEDVALLDLADLPVAGLVLRGASWDAERLVLYLGADTQEASLPGRPDASAPLLAGLLAGLLAWTARRALGGGLA